MSRAAISFLRRLPRLRSSLPLTNLTSSYYRLLSTADTTQPPPPNLHFAAVDYLIQSYGLPSDEALRTSKRIQHLKSPDKPDAVLCFLRQIGISESDIRTAVSREPLLLVSDVEKILRPNVAKLQEIGLSNEDISGIFSRSPGLFRFNILPKIDFWMRALGSLENMYVLLRRGPSLLNSSLEKVCLFLPNLSFLQNQCGLSVHQIVQLIMSAPRLVKSNPEAVKIYVKRALELGVSCSSQKFVYALITVSSLNESTLNSRVHNLKNLGLSQEDVARVIGKAPNVLQLSEELLGRKIELLKSMGLSQEDVARVIGKAPNVLQLSEELLGRKIELLKSMGLSKEDVARVIGKAPNVLQLSEEMLGRKIELLKSMGLSQEDVTRVIGKACNVLQLSEELLGRKTELLKSMGLSQEDVARVIGKAPSVLQLSEELLGRKIELLKSIGLSQEDVARVISRAPSVLQSSEELLGRKIELLKSMGLSQEDVARVIGRAPSVLQLSEELLGCKIELLKSMGLSKQDVARVIGKAPNVLQLSEELLCRKIQLLKSMGLSQEDVTCVIGKFPTVLQLSEEFLGHKMEFLINEAGCGKIDVVCNPILLAYHMEKRLIPRSIVRKLLMSKGLPVANKAFASFMQPGEKDFLEKFVLPFEHDIPGLGQAYANACAGKTGANE